MGCSFGDQRKITMEGNGNRIPVVFVFNSPTLIPWDVVDGIEDGELREKILLWQEARRQGYRYSENDCVADVNNPRQKMVVRRILRRNEKVGDEVKSRLVGIECYFWADAELVLKPSMRRSVPGCTLVSIE